MKPSIYLLIMVFFSFISFGFGVMTAQYRTFPYELIKTAKQLLIGKPEDYKPPRSSYYTHKKSFFEEFGQEKYDVVMVGDSITDEAEWEDLFPSVKIANRGVSGDTTDGVIERLDSIVSTHADKAFIMIGLNDFSRGDSVDSVFSRYQAIIETLQASDIEVYVQSTILGGDKVSHLNKSIISLNERLEKITQIDDSLTYINLNDYLIDKHQLNSRFSNDDIHLNSQGYRVWQRRLLPYLP